MMPRSRRAGRLVAAIACAVAATATTATPAFAYFRTGSIATASASVAQLTAPENVHAVAGPGATSVSVTWRAGSLPEGIVLDGYRVTRVENGTTMKNACTSSASILLSPTTVACDDQDVADGTYTYRVTAVFRTWSRTSDASEPVTVARDVDAPSADVTFPEYGHHYGPGQFDSGCSPTGACGTAADPSGVHAVSVSFSDGSSRFWDGHAFTSATPLYFAAELGSPGAAITSWWYPIPTPPDGVYDVRVLTTDNAGNTQPMGEFAVKSMMYIDTIAPTIVVSHATGQADPTNASTVHFAVTASERVTPPTAANLVVGGTAPGYTNVTVTGSGSTYDVAIVGMKGPGTVTLSLPAAAVHDEAGNTSAASTGADDTITYDPTPPKVTAINFTNGGTSGKVDQNDTIAVTFSEQLAVSTLCSAWNGDAASHSLTASNDVTVTVADNASNDRMTLTSGSCTLSLGTIALGANYTATTVIFRGSGASASTLSWNATTNVLTIKLGTLTGTVLTGVAAGKPAYTPPASPAIKDRAGNALLASFTETSNRAL